jgi:hypothetical protein
MAGINFISTTIRNDKLNAHKLNVIAAIKASALKAAAANKAAAVKAAAAAAVKPAAAAAVKPAAAAAVKPAAVKPAAAAVAVKVIEKHLKNVDSRKIVYDALDFIQSDESSAIVLKKMN